MNKKRELLIKSIIFVIGFIIINSLISAIYLSIDSNSVIYRSRQQFEEYNSKLKYLVIGDSHAQDALDTEIINNSFNYATIGENYILNYYKLKYVLEKELKGKDIKTIILPLDLHSFSSFGLNRLHNKHFWSKYINFFELGKVKNQVLFYSVQYLRGTFFPYELQGLTDSAKLIINPHRETRILVNGFASNDFAFSDISPTKRQLVAQERAQTFHQNQESLDSTAVYYFKQIIKIALDHNLKVLLIRFPVSSEYYQEAEKFMKVKPPEYYQQIDNLFPQDQGIKILDYHDYFFNQEHFLADPDHLNKKGAKIISNLVKEELTKFN